MMHINKMPKVLMFVAGLLVVCGMSARAALVDVIEFPTGFFCPDEEKTYDDPYYRFAKGDWGWSHHAIAGTINSATLNISAWDVDRPEVDNIYARDNGVWQLLGKLKGNDDSWGYTTFVLGANFFDDIANGLQIWMNIDVNNGNWAVTLAKSALSIDGGSLPDPDPDPSPVPEPATLALMGVGLLGFIGTWKRRAKQY